MRSVQSAQSQLDTYHEGRYKRAKEIYAKEKRKRMLIIGAAVIFAALLCKPLYDFVRTDARPIIYIVAFAVFLGLPLRIIAGLDAKKILDPVLSAR